MFDFSSISQLLSPILEKDVPLVLGPMLRHSFRSFTALIYTAEVAVGRSEKAVLKSPIFIRLHSMVVSLAPSNIGFGWMHKLHITKRIMLSYLERQNYLFDTPVSIKQIWRIVFIRYQNTSF